MNAAHSSGVKKSRIRKMLSPSSCSLTMMTFLGRKGDCHLIGTTRESKGSPAVLAREPLLAPGAAEVKERPPIAPGRGGVVDVDGVIIGVGQVRREVGPGRSPRAGEVENVALVGGLLPA